MDLLNPTIADLLGGADGVDAVVDEFYDRVLDDPTLHPYFADVDMVGQSRHLAATLQVLLGVPADHATLAVQERLVRAHARLAITDDAFDQTAGHLLDALAELRVAPDLIDEVILRLAAVRGEVVTAGELPQRSRSGSVPPTK